MQFLLLFFIIGFLGLIIENVESRRVYGSTHVVIFPKFYSRPYKVNHKFLPEVEYTVFYEKATTTPLLPSTTPSTTPKPIFPDFRTASTLIVTSESSTIPSTAATVTPSPYDSSFDWFRALIVLFITTCAALTFFFLRRKCSSPSGTYKIPKATLIPEDHNVHFSKIDDDFIEISARTLYGSSYITSNENHNLEEGQTDETWF